jgi:hypothetical protein
MNKLEKKKLWVLLALIIACGAVIFGSLFYNGDKQQEEIRYIRKNANSPEAQSDIEAMNKALSIMRQKGCTDPMSWYYQGAVHWIPDSIGKNPLCESYHTVADLKEAWDNCTHSPSGKEKIHFLVWHRLYIWHFEKIVRKLSGKKDFALPYWGYTNVNSSDKIMPSMLRDPKSSLYESCRFDGLNNGYPISGEIERALDLTKLMSYTDYHTFCMNINAAPHGAMHDYIGTGNDTTGLLKFNNPITGTITNTGLMGWVPTAGFDPVFWLHHSNIDRIWQQWTNSENGQMITLEELKSIEWPYVFFDENGKKVEYSMEEVIKIIYDMDYDFDDTKVKPKSPKTLLTSSNVRTIAVISNNVKVNNKVTNIKVDRLLTSSNSSEFSKMNMEVSVSFNKVPKGIYEVYLNIPSGEVPHPSSKYFVGFMNFFGFDDKKQGQTCKEGCCTPLNSLGRPYTNFYYELSEESVTSGKYNVKIYKHNQVVTDMIIDNIVVTGR